MSSNLFAGEESCLSINNFWLIRVVAAEGWCGCRDFLNKTKWSLSHCLTLSFTWLLRGHCRIIQFSSVQSLSHVRLFPTPWIAARQASLSITISRSSLKLTSIKSVMPSSHLILCCPLLLLPPISPSIRVFSNESTLRMRRPKYWSFSFRKFKMHYC